MTVITSRSNKLVQRWRELSSDANARRKERAAMLEAAHFVTAAWTAGILVRSLILSSSGEEKTEHAGAARHYGKAHVLVSDSVFDFFSDTETPAGIAAEIELPKAKPDLETSSGCVFLESVQDPGNVGGILRSAAAFGIQDVVLGRGCADVWSPKALRAAMGAHFSWRIAE